MVWERHPPAWKRRSMALKVSSLSIAWAPKFGHLLKSFTARVNENNMVALSLPLVYRGWCWAPFLVTMWPFPRGFFYPFLLLKLNGNGCKIPQRLPAKLSETDPKKVPCVTDPFLFENVRDSNFISTTAGSVFHGCISSFPKKSTLHKTRIAPWNSMVFQLNFVLTESLHILQGPVALSFRRSRCGIRKFPASSFSFRCQRWNWIHVPRICLVGGWTNPFEKYARQIGSFPQENEQIKYLKPPPSCQFLGISYHISGHRFSGRFVGFCCPHLCFTHPEIQQNSTRFTMGFFNISQHQTVNGNVNRVDATVSAFTASNISNLEMLPFSSASIRSNIRALGSHGKRRKRKSGVPFGLYRDSNSVLRKVIRVFFVAHFGAKLVTWQFCENVTFLGWWISVTPLKGFIVTSNAWGWSLVTGGITWVVLYCLSFFKT